MRVLQEKEYTPVGTTIALPVNVRFIASTNRDLKEEIKTEKFREDLYYRLNVVEINLPPLQERVEDIPLLADHFLNKYRTEMNKNIKGIDNQAVRALMTHKWKGEVRELENVIERAVIFSQDEFITIKDLPSSFYQQANDQTVLNTGSLEESVRNYERDLILKTLESNEFNKEKTAEQLQVGLSTLYRKLKELDIKS